MNGGGRINAQWRGYVWPNVTNLRLCPDRSVRLSSLTYRGCQFASSFVLWAVPAGLLVICSRDRSNLNYSFFELRLCPYEKKLTPLHRRGLDRRGNKVSIPSAVQPFAILNKPRTHYAHSDDRCRRFRRLLRRAPRTRRCRCSLPCPGLSPGGHPGERTGRRGRSREGLRQSCESLGQPR